MELIRSEYWNSGGNCFCMEAVVHDTPLRPGETLWLSGSTTCCDIPIIAFFKTAEDYKAWLEDGEESYMDTEELDGYGTPWIVELWNEMFQNAIRQTDGAGEKSYTAHINAVTRADYCDFIKGYHEFLAVRETEIWK